MTGSKPLSTIPQRCDNPAWPTPTERAVNRTQRMKRSCITMAFRSRVSMSSTAGHRMVNGDGLEGGAAPAIQDVLIAWKKRWTP